MVPKGPDTMHIATLCTEHKDAGSIRVAAVDWLRCHPLHCQPRTMLRSLPLHPRLFRRPLHWWHGPRPLRLQHPAGHH